MTVGTGTEVPPEKLFPRITPESVSPIYGQRVRLHREHSQPQDSAVTGQRLSRSQLSSVSDPLQHLHRTQSRPIAGVLLGRHLGGNSSSLDWVVSAMPS